MNGFNFQNFKNYLVTHKLTTALVVVLTASLLLGGNWLLQRFDSKDLAEEVDLVFDAEGPYALVYPRRDGNALMLKITRTGSYDEISYDLAYSSTPDETIVAGNKQDFTSDEEEGVGGSIDRGVSGTIDTKDKKGEYEQEILFGTCSKNVCKYDQGVENGTLTLHIRKGNKQGFSSSKAYKMITQWHLQKPDVALGSLTSGDGHFSYKIDASREELNSVGFSIVNDLTGVPKLPSGKMVVGKVYALNPPLAKELKMGEVSLELADNPSQDAKLYRYNNSSWEELETKVEGSKLSTKANGAGIFAVLTSKK